MPEWRIKSIQVKQLSLHIGSTNTLQRGIRVILNNEGYSKSQTDNDSFQPPERLITFDNNNSEVSEHTVIIIAEARGAGEETLVEKMPRRHSYQFYTCTGLH
jgi:hypothetical protein